MKDDDSCIEKEWDGLHQQYTVYDGMRYNVSLLTDAAKDLEVFKAKVKSLSWNYEAPCDNSLLSFSQHIIHVLNVDLTQPILLSPDGTILDGRHRLVKAIIDGEEFLLAKRFTTMPEGGVPEEIAA